MLKLLLVFSLSLVIVYGDDEDGLKVVPPNIAVQSGKTVQLTCQHYPEGHAKDTKVEWFMPDGKVPISQLVLNQSVINMTQSDILRYKSEKGILTIENATINDSGTYKCRKVNSSMEAETIIKVYEMPEYTIEIIVVLVINAVLVVIFIGCSVWTFVKERKQIKEQIRKQRLGHREIAIPAVKG